jgi:hypothetical protein
MLAAERVQHLLVSNLGAAAVPCSRQREGRNVFWAFTRGGGPAQTEGCQMWPVRSGARTLIHPGCLPKSCSRCSALLRKALSGCRHLAQRPGLARGSARVVSAAPVDQESRAAATVLALRRFLLESKLFKLSHTPLRSTPALRAHGAAPWNTRALGATGRGGDGLHPSGACALRSWRAYTS